MTAAPTCTSGLSGGGGGCSPYVVGDRRWIHPPGELGTDVGALVERLAVACHAVRLSGVKPSHSALVVGAGRIWLVTGSLTCCDDHADTIALVRDGTVDPHQFITGRIDLGDIVEQGFRELIDNQEENV